MRSPAVLLPTAVAAFAAWIVLTFVLDLRTGWTHLALVLGVLLTVAAIVEGVDRRMPPSGEDQGKR